jgi:hypothetical protein
VITSFPRAASRTGQKKGRAGVRDVLISNFSDASNIIQPGARRVEVKVHDSEAWAQELERQQSAATRTNRSLGNRALGWNGVSYGRLGRRAELIRTHSTAARHHARRVERSGTGVHLSTFFAACVCGWRQGRGCCAPRRPWDSSGRGVCPRVVDHDAYISPFTETLAATAARCTRDGDGKGFGSWDDSQPGFQARW